MMKTVDRQSFVMWCEGILLQRYADGRVALVASERECAAAEDALMSGETVALTVGVKIVAHVKLIEGVYQELSIDDGAAR